MLKTKHPSIKTIGLAIDELVSSLGIEKKLKEYNAVVFWESAVGEKIASVTKAVKIVRGVLFIQVKTSTWRNELVLRKKEIIKKINDSLGTGIVKDIIFQ